MAVGAARDLATHRRQRRQAHFLEAEIRYISGLQDKADIDDWVGGSRK
jgi:hypothetical protein